MEVEVDVEVVVQAEGVSRAVEASFYLPYEMYVATMVCASTSKICSSSSGMDMLIPD